MSIENLPSIWAQTLRTCDGQPERETELFFAHLALAETTSGETQTAFIKRLTRELPISEGTRAHLLAQEPARLYIYRELVRATHKKAVLAAIPRAAARMEEKFNELFSSFLAARGTHSHFLRDVTRDFLSFCRDVHAQAVAEYIWELAELEATRVVVASAPDPVETPEFELNLESGLIFFEAARVLSFKHAVHQLPEDERDRTAPVEQPTRLLSYRDPENKIRYLELSPLAACVICALMRGDALGASVKGACAELGEPLNEAVLAGCADVLSDLSQRGIVRGVRASS